MNRKIKHMVPLLGIVFFIYMLIEIGPMKIVDSLLGADLYYVSLMFAVYLPHLVTQNVKWRYILNQQDIRVGFIDIFKIYFIGMFYSIITPGKVGSLMRIAYLKEKSGKSVGECSSSVVIDRMMDMFSMIALSFIGIILFANYFPGIVTGTLLFVVSIFFVAFASIALFIMKERLGKKAFFRVHNFLIPEKYKERAKNASASFYGNIPPPRVLAVSFMLSVLSWILVYSSMYFASLSLGLQIPFMVFITTAPIATIVGLIPITISGWGTREAVLILLFSPFMASPEALVSMSFITFTTLIVPSSIGAFILLRGTIKKGQATAL